MAYYNKIGLLVLSEDTRKFLVCEPGEKYTDKSVTQYLMPGGKLEETSDIECLQAEILEELGCGVDVSSLKLIGEYTDAAATPGRDVMIRLYKGKLIGEPKPSTEIGMLHWIGKEDVSNQKVSPIIRNKIIPDLVTKEVINGV
jgi:8-oxo-dGTP diphosphatase